MTSPKFFHIRSSYFYGGPERQITYLTKSLARSGYESAVGTFVPIKLPEHNRYIEKLKHLDIPAYPIKISGSFDFSPIMALENYLRDNGFNVLVGHDYRADYFALKLAKNLRLPTMSFSRGWTRNTVKVRLYEWLDIRFLRKMDGIVAVSKDKLGELKRRGIPLDKLTYIPNSILIDDIADRRFAIRDRFGIPRDSFLVGTAGRLSIEKHQETMIEAAIDILTDHPSFDIRFIIAGEGPRREELAALIPDNLKDKIILAGWIEDNDAFYADIDLFVLTSRMEGFPNVLLEAGKYNRPAVSTPAGGATEIIDDGRSGLLMPFNDAKALADAIIRLYEDRILCLKLGAALGHVTREKFEAGANAAKFLEFSGRIRAAYE